MASPVLILRDTQLTFGGTPLLTGADLQVGPQDRICLVGRNGSGKSTLLKIAAGLVEPDAGERFVQPGVDIAYLPQEPDLTAYQTVGAYVDAGFAEGQSTHRGYAMLDALGVDPARHPGTLSGGEGRRAALARTLAPAPRVLLLDEPTNHLDLPTIEWLETTLDGNRGALVLISHDRRFLEKLSRRTVWLDRGTCRTLDKGFAAFEDWRDTVFETEAEDAHKLARRIAREEHWMQGGVSGRRKRNMRRVGELQRMRETQRTALAKPGSVRFEASEAEASGKLVIEARGVSKGYDSAAPVVRDVSIRIARGDRLGIVGANGAGKTTLVKLLTGRLDPDEGSVRQGANVEVLWLDQARGDLDDNATLTDVLTGGRGDTV
ncbi:MAG: ABC-F family ATP-binding cassette domain-containing protein, partial [Pseudomonadota bacterium]